MLKEVSDLIQRQNKGARENAREKERKIAIKISFFKNYSIPIYNV